MLDRLYPLLEVAQIPVESVQRAALAAYSADLYLWNERMNLTNVPQDDAWRLHFADSLQPLGVEGLFPNAAAVIDVGTGAGFPGLPLAIVRPDLTVVLLDALDKRCKFLTDVVNTLQLANVRVMHARAEDGARGAMRGQFDVACSRAVAGMSVLAEYLLPYVRIGGRALCWKGPAAGEETAAADHAIGLMGGQVENILPIPVPETDHRLVVIQKKSGTPPLYPRAAGTPNKKPL